MKIPRLVDRDFAGRTAISDVLNSCLLITEAANEASEASPLLDLARDLYGEAERMRYGRLERTAVLQTIEMQTEAAREQ